MLVELENVTKFFGRRPALQRISFQVAPGEVVGLAGPNGAGKTTTLRVLMGLLAAQEGRLRVLGVDPLSRRHIGQVGWMSERPSFPRYSLSKLIEFQAATVPAWDSALASELIERLELDPEARADRLSRGQAARTALLFALAHRPKLLILDDPYLGLDPGGRRILLGELLAAVADQGTGVLLSTHLLAEAERALDRLIVLQRGRVQLDERVEGLTARFRASSPDGPPVGLEDIFIQVTEAAP